MDLKTYAVKRALSGHPDLLRASVQGQKLSIDQVQADFEDLLKGLKDEQVNSLLTDSRAYLAEHSNLQLSKKNNDDQFTIKGEIDDNVLTTLQLLNGTSKKQAAEMAINDLMQDFTDDREIDISDLEVLPDSEAVSAKEKQDTVQAKEEQKAVSAKNKQKTAQTESINQDTQSIQDQDVQDIVNQVTQDQNAQNETNESLEPAQEASEKPTEASEAVQEPVETELEEPAEDSEAKPEEAEPEEAQETSEAKPEEAQEASEKFENADGEKLDDDLAHADQIIKPLDDELEMPTLKKPLKRDIELADHRKEQAILKQAMHYLKQLIDQTSLKDNPDINKNLLEV